MSGVERQQPCVVSRRIRRTRRAWGGQVTEVGFFSPMYRAFENGRHLHLHLYRGAVDPRMFLRRVGVVFLRASDYDCAHSKAVSVFHAILLTSHQVTLGVRRSFRKIASIRLSRQTKRKITSREYKGYFSYLRK